MTKYIFYSGKGGVGKTTMACATAIHHALMGKKTLIVTTDPASNLADVFEQEIGHKETVINIGSANAVPMQLYAMEIDPDEAAREYKENIIGPFRDIMPDDVIESLEENLSGPCTTEMASFDRFIDFMEVDDYDVIVFDTAPTGHTIRLLELPVDWSKHIEESAEGSGQTCLGPVQSLQGSKEKYDRAMALLKDPERTDFIFVMRPEVLSLYETQRAARELETIGICAGEIIINGIYPEDACTVSFFKHKFDAQQKVIMETETLISKPTRYMMLRDCEVKGIEALKVAAGELFKSAYAGTIAPRPCHQEDTAQDIIPSIDTHTLEKIIFPQKGTKAVFFTGKGGVGKTTISCITAMQTAERGFKTLIVTTDPAAHIGEVFDLKIQDEPVAITERLSAVMIDQGKAFIEYKERVLSEARGKYSDDMLKTMEEELNSPCIEEMAAFDKFIRFIESSTYDVIIFDTAPTGHTLRLLDLPFDYARQAEMMIDAAEGAKAKRDAESRFRNIIDLLRDRERAAFCLVLYPEATPILESYRAMLDLKEAGIETQLIVANMILPEEVCANEFFRNRRKMQMKYLHEINERFKLPVLSYPLFEEEVKGVERLRSLI
ncbi:TRC40/GET3/ArsA family transport-energizing ATPase [bacterium]|nr:TRC40/GET3/ArsA family transport-energizing ATPase [bacterium]